ncbi:DUF2778 domain-containing protein [Paraburkholderia sp. BL25I1N1]|uniref:DUF2778 domain-containing protein n=1 Tax=Paraburkholderia sp. BL25I1N1 TaxID=1938804 RepID=UPI000D04F033|nr:DUF2778 domain-containing protein [Paraburkholderia sp. BL25I1N1]PRY08731.1 uncharacterized protein DUF2778 [Paraburkholderia sp. BL25I1N1]
MPVKCTFVLNGQVDSVLSCDGTASVTAFSGTGRGLDNPADTAIPNVGPLPKGIYYLVDRQPGGLIGPLRDLWSARGVGSTDKQKWFTLWNPVSGDTTNIDGVERGNFRLHPMGSLQLSHGCITVKNPYEFERLQIYIRSRGRTLPVPRTTMKAYGTVEVK